MTEKGLKLQTFLLLVPVSPIVNGHISSNFYWFRFRVLIGSIIMKQYDLG